MLARVVRASSRLASMCQTCKTWQHIARGTPDMPARRSSSGRQEAEDRTTGNRITTPVGTSQFLTIRTSGPIAGEFMQE
jgi:hypothetical protein